MEMNKEIMEALDILSNPEDKWDYEEKQGPLWIVVKKYPEEIINYIDLYPKHKFTIIWCIANIGNKIHKDFILSQLLNRDHNVRWACYVYLKQHITLDLIDIFIKGLKDEFQLIKVEALDCLNHFIDSKIKNALKEFISLKDNLQNSPELVNQAKAMLNRYVDH